MMKTAAALYDDPESARKAMRVLMDHGFDHEHFSLITVDASGEYARELNEYAKGLSDYDPAAGSSPSQGSAVGAGIGAVLGGFGGLLAGLGVLTIAGIGPVLAAGPLALAVNSLAGAGGGAAAGGAAGGLMGALVNLDIPEEYAYLYVEGVRRGGTLLVVSTPEIRSADALGILSRFDPVDVDQRAEQWLEAGWNQSGPDELAPQYIGGYHYFEQRFRTHFSASRFARHYQYEDCEPAYRYGCSLGRSGRFRGRAWSEIEPEIRSTWEKRYPGTWNRFKKSIRYAWKESRLQ